MLNRLVVITYNASILIPFIFAIGVVKGIEGKVCLCILCLFVCLLSTFAQLKIKKWIVSKLAYKRINVTSLKRDDNSKLIVVYISYFLPFLKLLEDKVEYSSVISILVGCFLVIGWHKGIENPVLKILGYKTYHIGTQHGVEYILLSRREIRDLKSIKYVARITENRLIEEE